MLAVPSLGISKTHCSLQEDTLDAVCDFDEIHCMIFLGKHKLCEWADSCFVLLNHNLAV